MNRSSARLTMLVVDGTWTALSGLRGLGAFVPGVTGGFDVASCANADAEANATVNVRHVRNGFICAALCHGLVDAPGNVHKECPANWQGERAVAQRHKSHSSDRRGGTRNLDHADPAQSGRVNCRR